MGAGLPEIGGFLAGVADAFNSVSSVWSTMKGLSQQDKAWTSGRWNGSPRPLAAILVLEKSGRDLAGLKLN